MTRSAEHNPETLVPPGFAPVAPILQAVVERWHESESAVSDWDSACTAIPAREADGWAATVERLQLINTFQWHEEDRSRDSGANDTTLAEVKRSIDASNRRRVQTVDCLDDQIHTGLQSLGVLDAAAPLNSESPGSIIDRLSVLVLKIYHVGEAVAALSGDDPDELRAMQGRLAILTEQMNDLGTCLDRLLDGIRAGRIGLKLYRQVKIYRQADTGKLKADLD